MLTSIVVALDVEHDTDRALPVAQSLGGLLGLPVDVVTVAVPERTGTQQVIDLERRARLVGLGARSILVLQDDDPARAIAAQVDNCDGAMLVMSTAARSALGLPVHGSVSEEVLGHVHRPVLLIGPHVTEPCHMDSPTLVACIDGSDRAEAAVPIITSWTRAFDRRPPWFVEVIPALAGIEPDDDLEASAHLRAFAERCARPGIGASWKLLRSGDPVAALRTFADSIPQSVLVVTSDRWPGTSHWYSTTRKLVRWSPRPVLVVPADAPNWQRAASMADVRRHAAEHP